VKKQLFFLSVMAMVAIPFVGAYAEDSMGGQTQQQQTEQQRLQQERQRLQQERQRLQQERMQRRQQRLADGDDGDTSTNPATTSNGAMQDTSPDDGTMNENPDQSKLYADDENDDRHDREENGNDR